MDNYEFSVDQTKLISRSSAEPMLGKSSEDVDPTVKLEQSLNLLTSVVNGIPNIILAKDLNRRYSLANDAAAAYFGVSSPDQLVGRADEDFFKSIAYQDLFRRVQAYDDQVLATGNSVTYEAFDPSSDNRLQRTVLSTTKSPIRNPKTGEIVGIVGISQDITERLTRERRDRFIYDMMDRIRTIADPEEILNDVVASLQEFLDCALCAFHNVDDILKTVQVHVEHMRVVREMGIKEYPISALGEHFERCLRNGHPLVVSDVAQEQIPDDTRLIFERFNVRSLVIVPIFHNGNWVGILVVQDDIVRQWHPGNVMMLSRMAERIWLTYLNAQLNIELRRLADRQSFLADTTRLLNESLHYETSLAAIARRSVPGFADWCVVDLANDDQTHLDCIAIEHASNEIAQIGKETRNRYRSRIQPLSRFDSVLKQGKSVFTPVMTDEALRTSTTSDTYYKFIQSLNLKSAIIVPIRSGNRIHGAITFATTTESNYHYTQDDLSLAEEIGQRAGMAVENSLLYKQLQYSEARHRRIAETLQTAIISPPLSEAFKGFEIDLHYEAAEDDADIGGDYGDVFRVDENRVALLVGDCTGKGLDAARFVGECQFTLRAFLRSNPDDPAQALALLNRMVLDGQMFDERSRTAMTCLTVAIVNLKTGATVVATGGAEPSFVVHASQGHTEFIDAEGPIIGFDPIAQFRTVNLTLLPGDMIVLYTDGITEARRPNRGELYGGQRLVQSVETLCKCNEPMKGFAKKIAAMAKEFAGGILTDDSCIVAARRLLTT